jgi:nucleotide-binding universal stress UspA family protein
MSQTDITTRMRKILLSTDGSEFSEGAVREAIRLAKMFSGSLTVLSVVETNPEFETLAIDLAEEEERRARELVESVKALAEKEGVQCAPSIRRADAAYKGVIDEAADSRAELVMMGRRGKTGLKRLLMGSVTAKVIGHSPCNVLVVPKAARIDFRSIVVATDGSRFSAAAASEAIGIAGRFGARLIAISVVPSEESSPFDIVQSEMRRDMVTAGELEAAERNVSELEKAADAEGVHAEGIVMGGRPFDAIVDIAAKRRADLIVVGSHGRTGMQRLLMGSVTERVVGQSESSVLIVKASAAGI